MLSSFPPELLHQIIESTVPHSFHTTTYYSRQRTLCSLSLVSKRFQAIAQPLLHEMVWIKSSESLDLYNLTIGHTRESDNNVGKRRTPQIVVIESGSIESLSQEKMSKDVPRFFSSVKSLTWDFGYERVNFWSVFLNLSSLYLSSVSFASVNIPSLPTLRSLTMYDVGSSVIASLLDPAVVPNLKHFSLVDSLDTSVRQLKESRIADLLPQLETINLELPIWTRPEFTFLHPAAERTLIDCAVNDLGEDAIGAAKVIHLRIVATTALRLSSNTDTEANIVVRDLKDLNFFIQSTPELSLRSQYLDSSLRPRSTLPHSIVEAMVKLIDACRERSIDVVFDSIPNDHYIDPWISAAFVRRQKTSKTTCSRGSLS